MLEQNILTTSILLMTRCIAISYFSYYTAYYYYYKQLIATAVQFATQKTDAIINN